MSLIEEIEQSSYRAILSYETGRGISAVHDYAFGYLLGEATRCESVPRMRAVARGVNKALKEIEERNLARVRIPERHRDDPRD